MEKVTFKFALGINARDRVTGQEGILDMRAQYLNGCVRYSLQPKISPQDPTKRPDSYWIDEQQLELVDQGLNQNPIKKQKTGGPVEKSTRARI